MIKLHLTAIGTGLALSLAACAPPAAEQTSPEAIQVEQVTPENSDPQARGTQSQEGRPRQNAGGERRAAPEMAYTACEGLAAAAACSFETPRGARTGVCQTQEGESRAVCFVQRPEGGPRGGERPNRPGSGGE